MTPIHLRSIGILAPGLADWRQTAAILRGETDYVETPIPPLAPPLLPPNERRRATPPTRLALRAAQQAAEQAVADISTLTSVFASADGDMDLIDRLCKGIAQAPVALSPTLFHNSVHNAAAGYWSIGGHCMAPSTSIAAGDGSLAAGLIESATQLATDCHEILLVAYDLPAPLLLDAHRHFHGPFACALVLGRERRHPHLASLVLDLEAPRHPRADSGLPSPLETMRAGNPAARVLPLLRGIALRQPGSMQLPYLDGLALSVTLESIGHDT